MVRYPLNMLFRAKGVCPLLVGIEMTRHKCLLVFGSGHLFTPGSHFTRGITNVGVTQTSRQITDAALISECTQQRNAI